MNLDPILEKSIDSISDRISDVESEYFKIAGERLKKIYLMSKKELETYLYSGEFLHDARKDITKTKRKLLVAHRQNLKQIITFEKQMKDKIRKDANELIKASQ